MFLDAVDFNKSCLETTGKYLPYLGIPVDYVICSNCGFCFSPEIATWKLDDFNKMIYNEQYVIVDPDYIETRPRANAANLISMFGHHAKSIRHLDYGGGSGLLAKILKDSKWESVSYDPLVDTDASIDQLGKFDLITAFEVFEHVPDVQKLMENLRSLLSPNGIILFSTLISDDDIQINKKLSWWYASPRNGHISLFSRKSLTILAQNYGLKLFSFSAGFHAFFSSVPPWADQFISLT